MEDKNDGRDGGRLIGGRVVGSPVGRVGDSCVGTEPVVGGPFGRPVGSPGIWIVGGAVANGKVVGSPVERPGGKLRGSELGRPGLRPLGGPV